MIEFLEERERLKKRKIQNHHRTKFYLEDSESLCCCKRISQWLLQIFLATENGSKRDTAIVHEIKQIHSKTHRVYSYRRLKITLERNLGHSVNKKRIQRIQKEYGPHACIRRRQYSYPKSQFQIEPPKENILDRNFNTE